MDNICHSFCHFNHVKVVYDIHGLVDKSENEGCFLFNLEGQASVRHVILVVVVEANQESAEEMSLLLNHLRNRIDQAVFF